MQRLLIASRYSHAYHVEYYAEQDNEDQDHERHDETRQVHQYSLRSKAKRKCQRKRQPPNLQTVA